ncbi:precorrin-8X methylmutase [Desulfomarina sp.]
MTITIREIEPHEIENESFRIISRELGIEDHHDPEYKVIQRVIHATGDFSFHDNMRLSPGAVEAAKNAIRSGKNILTDVTMVAAGISKTMLAKWGGRVFCKVADEQVAEIAKATGKTRSEVAMEKGLNENIGIIAIGNAPTALLQAIKLVDKMAENDKPLIVGVPVGFVNAAESKALLHRDNSLHITSLGRKGGSPVAAAIVNALIRLAQQ